MPKTFIFGIVPSLNSTAEKNPDAWFDLYIASHADHRRVRAIFYNNKRRGEGTRDEVHITNFGGRQSAVLDPESTGALTIFAFALDEAGRATECHVWVCDHGTQEELIEERIGPVEPGENTVWAPAQGRKEDNASPSSRAHCHLSKEQMPQGWLERFPTGEEIIRKVVSLRSTTSMSPDQRLVRRRQCEYELFQSVEEAVYLPRIVVGFTNISGFPGLAQTILQSRKSRSGNSLELHAREIFIEEGLRSMQDFQHKPVSEDGKRPDFLFPSQAAKTTCKDRWRQITHEADRIPVKHRLTLQEGVSEAQFREMKGAGVQLVVPTGLHDSFPAAVRRT